MGGSRRPAKQAAKRARQDAAPVSGEPEGSIAMTPAASGASSRTASHTDIPIILR
jgi:hypothetical protein